MILAAVETTQAIVMAAAFALITAVGLLAGRWRKADLHDLDEWALGGRKLGGVLTWFLQGGSVYTTYAFIAVPAVVFGKGAIGFFALPYLVIAYPIAFVVLPRLWQAARERGYVTPADFVRDRFGSRALVLAVTGTGLVATMPYIALQVYGIEVSIAQIGLPVEASLWLSFAILAVVTYVAGLRSATLIAIVKDVLIWITVIVALVYIPIRLGGYGAAFAKVPAARQTLPPGMALDYVTLAVGSAILFEAGLSFLGLGDPNQMSWGLMIGSSRQYVLSSWWAVAFPGAAIFVTVLAVSLIGDGLNDALNPKLRER